MNVITVVVYFLPGHGSPSLVRLEQLWKLPSGQATSTLIVLISMATKLRLARPFRSALRRELSKERMSSSPQNYGNKESSTWHSTLHY